MIFYWFKINIQETVRAEVGDVSGFPFQLKFLFSNSINFFKALINIKWFSFIGVLLVFGVAFIYKIIKYNYNFIYPFAIVIMFLIVYGSHYRSYYYIVLGEIAPLDAIRYLVIIFPIISICTVIVIKFIYVSIEKNLFKIRKLVQTSVLYVQILAWLARKRDRLDTRQPPHKVIPSKQNDI